MQGHFNYYGVPGNRKALDTFRRQIQLSWLQALRRRSQKARSLTWERMKKLISDLVTNRANSTPISESTPLRLTRGRSRMR